MIVEKTSRLGNEALEADQEYSAFLGISINHPFFSKENIKSYTEWCSEEFDEFYLLLMDDPDRHNFRVFKDMDETQAREHARQISDELSRGYRKVKRGGNHDSLHITRFKDFTDEQAYQTILGTVQDRFETHDEFHQSLRDLMQVGIGEKINDDPNITATDERVLANYIIEELASIIYYTEHIATIELDPTRELTTKKELYEDTSPEITNELSLSDSGHIYVHPDNATKDTF